MKPWYIVSAIVAMSCVLVSVVSQPSAVSDNGNDTAHFQSTDSKSDVPLGVIGTENGSESPNHQEFDARIPNEIAPLSDDEQQLLVDEVIQKTFFEKRGREQFTAGMREFLTHKYGPQEADFYADLLTAEDWFSARDLIEKRATSSGQNYDAQMMEIGLVFGNIGADEIQTLVNRGAELPQNTLSKLARKGQVDTIVSLVDAGLLSDLNAVNPDNGRNALSETIVSIGRHYYRYSPTEAANAIEQLISVGVVSTNFAGGRDSLDYALDGIDASNANVKLAMVRALVGQGRLLTDAQRELINAIPNVAAVNTTGSQ